MINESLGNLLRRYRLNCGYSQQAIANALGVDRSTYTYYETRRFTPSLKTVLTLKNLLNIPYDEILGCFGSFESNENDVVDSDMEKMIPVDRNSPMKASIYELPRDEKQLVLFYRSLNLKKREKLMRELQRLVNINC